MITFYLAAKLSKRDELLPIASLLMMQGHTVKTRWLMGLNEGTKESQVACADVDLNDIDDATHVVLFNLPTHDPEFSTGRQIEYGYALARGKTLVIVGECNSVFHAKADHYYPTVTEFLEAYAPDCKY